VEVRSLAAVLALMLPASGETSVPLGLVSDGDAHVRPSAGTPAWRQSLDVGGDSGNGSVFWSGARAVAVRDGIVVFRHGARMCAFDEATGRTRWCDRDGVDPVALDGVLAYSAADSIRAVGLRDGRLRWVRALRAHHPRGATDGFDRQPQLAHRLFAAGDSLLALRRGGAGPFRGATVGELDAHGTVLWSEEDAGGFEAPVAAPPFAIWPISLDGAITTTHQLVVRLGRGGGILGEFGNYDTVLAVRSPKVLLTGGWRPQEAEDYELRTEIAVADLRKDVGNETYEYQPDYDDNRARMRDEKAFRSDYLHGTGKHVGVEGAFVYVRIGRRYYRYRLENAAGQHPAALAFDGDWVAGPYLGALYVRRDDGLHALRFGEGVVHAMRVAGVPRSRGVPERVTAVALHGNAAYFGFADGSVVAVDARDGRTLLAASAHAGQVREIVVTPRHVLFACDPGPQYPPVTSERTLAVIGHVKAVSGRAAPIVNGPVAPVVSRRPTPLETGRRVPVVPQSMSYGMVVAFPRPDRA
jgi:prepilin-type processing-associated H-X9-DG protein